MSSFRGWDTWKIHKEDEEDYGSLLDTPLDFKNFLLFLTWEPQNNPGFLNTEDMNIMIVNVCCH